MFEYVDDLTIAVVGTAMFVVMLIGCLGAVRKNSFILNMYTICLSMFLIYEVILGIFLYEDLGKVDAITRNDMFAEFHNYFVESRSHYEVNEMQQDLHCCGIDGPIYWIERNVTSLPCSCCPDSHSLRVTTCNCSQTDAWSDGCLQKSIDIFRVKLCKIIASTGSVNLIGMGYALYLGSNIRKEKRRFEILSSIY